MAPALMITLSALFFLLMAVAPAGATRLRVTAQDRAATRSYLEARYSYDQAIVTLAPAADAATEALARHLSSECPGVVTGAPGSGGFLSALLEPSPRRQTPRQAGEANRAIRQLSLLQLEVGIALALPRTQAERQPLLAFTSTVRTLRWSNKALTAYIHATAGLLPQFENVNTPSVCTDLREWAMSDFKKLAPATKSLSAELTAIDRPFIGALRALLNRFATRDPLRAYEGPHERALAAKIVALEAADIGSAKRLDAVESGLRRTLGLESQAEAEASEQPAKGSTEIGHGITATGSSYTVWVEPKSSSRGTPLRECEVNVGVYENQSAGAGVDVIETGSAEACLSRRHPMAPSVHCDSDGVLTIEAQTPANARSAQLVLSDGRSIKSTLALIPASLGGPIGFYYQTVRGPSRVPVALRELDQRGEVLRTVKLPRSERCTRRERRRTSRETRTIARGDLPQGGRFAITGVRITSEYAPARSRLSIEVTPTEGFGIGSFLAEAGGSRGARSSPFSRELETGCLPHEFAIVYGVLKNASDTVLVRSSGGLEALHRARIPANLHLGSVLAYIALPSVPSEVLVRTRAGRIVQRETLTRQQRDSRETCEGEAEG
jgi:hypothetical protein